MPTNVYYNGVEIHNVTTRQWDQKAEFEDSHTDPLFFRYQFAFDGIIHAQGDVLQGTPSYTARRVGGNANTAIGVYQNVRNLLAQPRGKLEIKMQAFGGGEVTVFQCDPCQYRTVNHDVENGPKPTSLAITAVAGTKCFRVSFSIECCVMPCTTGSLPNVLNNRWSVREELDDSRFLTRSIRGNMRFRKTTAEMGIDYRWLVVPQLEPGFRRDRIEFAVDKTGLACEYAITDKQIHTAAPWPAAKMTFSHTESTYDGVTFMADARVELEGPPNADKKQLITRAIQVLDARLQFTKKQWGTDYICEHARITEHIGERNAVEASMRVRQFPTEEIGAFLANLRKDRIGKPLQLPALAGEPQPYNPHVSEMPDPYGYTPDGKEKRLAVLALLQCYLQMPCVDEHAIAFKQQPPGRKEDVKDKKEFPTIEEKGAIESAIDDWINDEAKSSIYTYWAMGNRYATNKLRVQLPRAAAGSSYDDSEGSQDTCTVFTLAHGICRRIITIDMERVGSWPQVPEPVETYQDGELKGTLLSHVMDAQPVVPAPDSMETVYRITARYIYAINRPPKADEKMNTGVLPFAKVDQVSQFDPEAAYSRELI